MTRKRIDDDGIINIAEAKKQSRLLDLMNEYLKKRREIEVESVD